MMRPQAPLKNLFNRLIFGVLSVSLLTISNSAVGQLADSDSRAPAARVDQQMLERIAIEEMSEQDIEAINGKPLIARKPLPKSNPLIKPTGYDARLIVKFVDSMKARPQDNGMIMSRARQSTFEVDLLAKRYGAVFSSPFRKLEEGDLNRIRAKAALNSGKAQPDLAGMMYIEAPDSFMQPLAEELQALDCVEWIAYETLPEPHGFSANTSLPAATVVASATALQPTGACCLPTAPGCVDITQATCNQLGGSWQTGTCATANICDGACCLAFPSQAVCQATDALSCVNLGGTFDLNTVGVANPCAQAPACRGRACDAAGACQDNVASNLVAAVDFSLSTCALDPCPPPPATGACCLPVAGDDLLEDADCIEGVSSTQCATLLGVFEGGITCDQTECLQGACVDDFSLIVNNQPGANITVTTLEACVTSGFPNPSFAGFGHGANTTAFDTAAGGLFGSCCLGDFCLVVFGSDNDAATDTCNAIGEELGVPGYWARPEFNNTTGSTENTLCTQATTAGGQYTRCSNETGMCLVPQDNFCQDQGGIGIAACLIGLDGIFLDYRDDTGFFPPLRCEEPVSGQATEQEPGDEALFGACCFTGDTATNIEALNVFFNLPPDAQTPSCRSAMPSFVVDPLTGQRMTPYTVATPDPELPPGIPKAICDRLGYPWEVIFTENSTDCLEEPCPASAGNFPCGYNWFWPSWTDLVNVPILDWPNLNRTPIVQTPSQRYQGPCHQALTWYNCWDYGDPDGLGVVCCEEVVGIYAGCAEPNNDFPLAPGQWNTFCQQLAMTLCEPPESPIEQVGQPLLSCPVVYAGLGNPRPNSTNLLGYCPCIGSVLAGPCDQPNGTRGCENVQCCTTVCAIEGFGYCCTAGWDEGCAQIASIMCERSQENAGDQLFPPIPRCSDPMCAGYDTPDFTEGQGYLTPIQYGFREFFYGGQVSPDFPALAFPTPTAVVPNVRPQGYLPNCFAFPSGIDGYMGEGLYLEEWRKKKVDPFWYKWAGLYGIGAEYQREYGRDLASTDGVIYNRTRGYGINVGVIDYSYTEMHEDLNVTPEPGVTMMPDLPEPFGPAHGTAVLGIINAIDQTRPNPGLPNNQQPDGLTQIGVVGIAPEANALFFPLVSLEDGARELEAWTNAINTLGLGDVLCIPYGPQGGGGCVNTVEATWTLANVATDLGITVVMSAGNASVDLNAAPEFGDNGVIITGASTPGGASSGGTDDGIPEWDASVTQGALPLYFSNWNSAQPVGAGDPSAEVPGNQVSLTMWGQNVYSTGGTTPIVDLSFNSDFPNGFGNQPCYDPADPFPIGRNWNPSQAAEPNVAYGTRILERAYTNDFGGTSAAAAMVAAVVCDVQGFHNQFYGVDASPQQIRAALCGSARSFGDPLIPTADQDKFWGFGTPRPRDACLDLIAQSDLAYDDSPWLDELYILTGDLISGNIFSVKGNGDNNFLVLRTRRTGGVVSTDDPAPFNQVNYPVRGPITDIGLVVNSDANRFSAAEVTAIVDAPAVRTAFYGYIYNPRTGNWDYLLDSFTLLEPNAEDDEGPGATEDIVIPIQFVNNYIKNGDLKIRFWTYQIDSGGAGLSVPSSVSSGDPHPSDYSIMRYEFIGFELENGGGGAGGGGGIIVNNNG